MVARIRVPLLLAAAEGDAAFAKSTAGLFQAAGATDKKLLLVPGGAHGVALLAAGADQRVRAALFALLARAQTG